ncbi:trichohyalin-like [Lytechinus variegatus]|uniref:trichohyalin-like n=1 Tax=Lytechinus variegatus TaxID=7654 RepID=UPI001BB12D01|nr:trichohyalin-like [Lytechinus variegatus]XP_041474868.1 trichohyalin-like [Lytechinus variegatus]
MGPIPPLRIKLWSRGSTNDEASSSTATARSTEKKVHWRTRMRERKPEKYAELRKHEQKYKRHRDATLKGEKLERELTRERVRRFRDRQRAEHATISMGPLPPLRIKLQSRGSTNDEASNSTATARSKEKKVHWRTHMRERKPEKYAELRKHEQIYKRHRDATLEGEKLERERELTRERVRRFRERQRAERAMVKKNNQPKSKSQKAKEKRQQEKWRMEKRKQRETWSAEKRKEYNMKQRTKRIKDKEELQEFSRKKLLEEQRKHKNKEKEQR